ncbi:MAG: phosphoglycerate dehydrogenase [Flavobacteriales bacterium]|nr:phosphoglycerate dehydrogenase [Flavobacteriales bacterium]
MKVLVTCPPMLGMIDEFRDQFAEKGIELIAPNVVQTLSEEQLMEILPGVDGWIIGDDPATERVFEAGKKGNLKAAVKWGVGVDNVDFKACEKLGIPIINTPNMFGAEVADIAVSYVIGLARETYAIDRGVRNNQWPKPAGISLTGKHVALVGFGDIGKAVAKRLHAFDMFVHVYDPLAEKRSEDLVRYGFDTWPNGLGACDFVVTTCALNQHTKHMINQETLSLMKNDVRIVNVSRGPIIDENALINAIESGKVHSVGLDVFEVEPLPQDSKLRTYDKAIFGTHNGSNTKDAVMRASHKAISLLFGFLKV